MSNKPDFGSYIDENGIRNAAMPITEGDKKITETINSSRTIAAMEDQNEQLKRQNDLYEKEIKELSKTRACLKNREGRAKSTK